MRKLPLTRKIASAAILAVAAIATTGCKGSWNFGCKVGSSGWSCNIDIGGAFIAEGNIPTDRDRGLSESTARKLTRSHIEDTMAIHANPLVSGFVDWSSLQTSVNGNSVDYSVNAHMSGSKAALQASFAVASLYHDVNGTWDRSKDEIEIHNNLQ